jgi:hypothetical protein
MSEQGNYGLVRVSSSESSDYMRDFIVLVELNNLATR